MKITVKDSLKRMLSLVLSFVLAFSLCAPAFAVEETTVATGTVEAITAGFTVEGTKNILVTNEEETTLYFSKANPSIGRMEDGWWAGIKVIAPAGLTEKELKAAKYLRTDANGTAEKSFWSVKDSADDAAVHYVEMWIMATPELIEEAEDGKLTTTYVFDWYGNGFDSEVQKIDFVLDTEKLNLDHENHYASAQTFTEGLAVDGTEELTITNEETVNLTFSRRNDSVGRYYDGWWAGIRVFAPEGLTTEQIKNAKYRKWNGTGWDEAKLFWNIKDSKNDATVHYFDSWMCVTPELIEKDTDKKLSVIYEFDWDNNGFGISTQKVSFVLDVTKINLDMDTFTGSVAPITNGITVSGKEEITATNEEEITLYYSKANPSIGRMEDGWWAGIKVIAPAGLTEKELKAAKYLRTDANGTAEKSFWSVKDSADDAAVHYVEMWIMATPELIEEAEDGKLTTTYVFDWYGNGFDSEVQKIDFVLDTEKLNLDHENHYASAQTFTEGLAVDGTEELTITNEETVNLTFSRRNDSVGRYYDGWWAGIRVFAPEGLTTEQIKNAKYRKWNGTGWDEAKLFWNIKDSKNDATVHYFDSWMCVTPELIEKDTDKKLSVIYEFDWDNNGFGISTQKVSFVLDVTKINLDMDTFTGSVAPITNGITVSGKEEITATNEEEITLYYSKANPSIGRMEDGWWAGIKVIAPAGLTEKELKAAKYLRTDANGTAEKSFWSVKDSADDAAVHYVEMWIMATPELIEEAEDGKLTTTYVFDWYGNGFDSEVQKIDFVLDTEKLNLDHENHYGTINGITSGLIVSGTTDMVIRNEEEITIDFSLKDESIGRYMDAWWVGTRIYAPEDMTLEELKEATYNNGAGVKSFWQFKDSADDADRHYIEVWVPVIQDWIDNDKDGILNWVYEFDWDNNGYGISTQEFKISIDVNKINRIHSAGCTKIVEEDAVAPDCENAGQNEKSYCDVCGLVFGDGAVLPALGHTDGEAVIENDVKPDCENAGSYDTVTYCTVCGDETSRVTTTVAALGHDFTEMIINDTHLKEKGENESTYYYNCSRCDTISTEDTYTLNDADINVNFGTINGITSGLIVSGTTDMVIRNEEEITIDFSLKDESIGRYMDAWWVGTRIYAPEDMTLEELKEATYNNGAGVKSFWQFKDSADDADRHYIEVWVPVIQDWIDNDKDGILNWVYEFDWDNNGYGISTQEFKISIDVNKINRIHSAGCTKIVEEDAVAPDCENAGQNEKSYCDVCGLVFGDGAVLPALGHTDGEAVIENDVKPDCENAGSYDTVTYCTVCGDETSRVTTDVPELGHIDGEAVIENDVKPDCENAGSYDTVTYCTVCGDETSRVTTDVPALGHTDGEAVIENDVKPDCVKKGSYDTVTYCTVCGDETSRVTTDVPALGHTDGEAVIENDVKPDCVKKGSYDTVTYCTVCGDETSRVTTTVAALGHTNGKEVIENDIKPDCVNKGSYDTARYCTVCGDETSRITTTVAALGHTNGKAEIENDIKPDCVNKGSYDTVKYCVICGDETSRVTTTVSALGHDYSEKIIDSKHLCKAKTCTTYAKYYYDCTRCSDMTSKTFENKDEGLNAHVKTRRIDKKYLVSAADCENPAKYYMGCGTCDTVFKGETFTDGTPLYHYFSVEKVTTKAGINKNGATDFFCKDCGKAYGDPIPFAGIKSVQLSGTTFSYTGKAITPAVTVKDSNGKVLKNGNDYTVTYSSNVAPGKAAAKITFKGSYTGSTTLNFTINQLPATKKITFASSTSAVKLTWEAVAAASGYKVYVKTSNGWSEVGSTTKNSLTVKKLTAGTKYTFMVKAYAQVDSKVYVSDALGSIYTVTKAAATKKLTATQTATSITLSWSKVSGADGYRVYKYNSKTKKYELYKTLKETKITIKKLKSGTSYKYLVKAVTLTEDKVKVTGEEKKITASTLPAATKASVTSKNGTVTVKWSKVTGATGYRIYCMDSKTKKLKLIGTVKGNKTTFKKKGYKKGSKYVFAVRAYRTVGGQTLLGGYSKITVKVK